MAVFVSLSDCPLIVSLTITIFWNVPADTLSQIKTFDIPAEWRDSLVFLSRL